MKEIFQRKQFWVILVILLLAIFIYPPFVVTSGNRSPNKGLIYREWAWIFSPPAYEYHFVASPEYIYITGDVDFKMILAESIIAILLSIGVCLIPFSKGRKKVDSQHYSPQQPFLHQ